MPSMEVFVNSPDLNQFLLGFSSFALGFSALVWGDVIWSYSYNYLLNALKVTPLKVFLHVLYDFMYVLLIITLINSISNEALNILLQ